MTDTTANISRNLRAVLRPSVVISVSAVLAAALLGLALIFAMGVPVMEAVTAFVNGTVGSPYAIAASINRSIAFALVGIGFVVANEANLVNVGGEGQIAVGGIAATAVALYGGVSDLPAGLPFLIPLIAAAIAGMLWGSIAAVLKIKAGTNEVISTLLVVVHRGLARVLVRAIAGTAAQADDHLRDATGIPGNSGSNQAAAIDRRLFLPRAYRLADNDRHRACRRDRVVEDCVRSSIAGGRI